MPFNHHPHLAKRPSDLKQNGTQERSPFSSKAFNTLFLGVIHVFESVSSKNHLLTGWNFDSQLKASFNGFLKLTHATKQNTLFGIIAQYPSRYVFLATFPSPPYLWIYNRLFHTIISINRNANKRNFQTKHKNEDKSNFQQKHAPTAYIIFTNNRNY